MALYAALTFWLVVIMFTAWGVHRTWSTLVRPRVVNSVLLPGTLVAELGHVLGLLLSGNSVQHITLMGDDDKAEPQADSPEAPRLPIVGPILVGLLPLVACAACLYGAACFWGSAILASVAGTPALQLPQALPTTLPGVWELLRGCISLTEAQFNAILHSDLPNPRTALFVYLAVCLTVRMAPFAGNRRGALAAAILAAVVASVLASLWPTGRAFIQVSSWPVLSFAVGTLLFLLLVSLLVRGVLGLILILVKNK